MIAYTMLKEINIFGLYLPPIIAYLAIAAVIWLALRWLFQKIGAYRHIWHAPLFNAALYVIIVGALFIYLD